MLTHKLNHMLIMPLMHMLIMPTYIVYFCIPRCTHAPIVAAKVIWLSFVMTNWMHQIVMFGFEKLTFRTKKSLGIKINYYFTWYRYALRLQDIGSGGTLIVVAQGTWLEISTTLQPRFHEGGTVTFGDDSKGNINRIGVDSLKITEDKSSDADLTQTRRSCFTETWTSRLMLNTDLSLSSVPL